MTRFVVGEDRSQSTLFPERLEDYLSEDNPVRAIDVFVDELDLAKLGFGGVEPEATGRPAYHPATLLKIYVYGYLNRVQSSRRLERECQRNIELVWLKANLPILIKPAAAISLHRQHVCSIIKAGLNHSAARADHQGRGGPKKMKFESHNLVSAQTAWALVGIDALVQIGHGRIPASAARTAARIAILETRGIS
jgi:hypothetical protein